MSNRATARTLDTDRRAQSFARVVAPAEPLRLLLLTWPLLQARDAQHVPPIEIPEDVRSRDRATGGSEWRDVLARIAWDYEHRYGIGKLPRRLELLRGALDDLRELGFDIDSGAGDSIVATLQRISSKRGRSTTRPAAVRCGRRTRRRKRRSTRDSAPR